MKPLKSIKTFIYVSVIFGLILSFSSCKKYEEGPALSLASKKGRVANTWKIEAEYKNGIQQTLDADDLAYRIEFTKDGKVIEKITDTGVQYTYEGTWTFASDKEQITVTMHYPGGAEVQTYTILRLKSNELWITYTESNGDKHEFHMISA